MSLALPLDAQPTDPALEGIIKLAVMAPLAARVAAS